ncbi:Smr/MutS family protein [Candidatus Latescibacterota bacterium]
MAVRVGSLDANAVVEHVLDGGKKAQIRIGTSKATLVIQTGDLYMTDTPVAKPPQKVKVNVSAGEVDSQEIDLRGMTFDEASDALEGFLDRLHISGLETAHIIHGKGTGALRTKIGAYLDKHQYVESLRLGNWNEGSTGVTVVTLRK